MRGFWSWISTLRNEQARLQSWTIRFQHFTSQAACYCSFYRWFQRLPSKEPSRASRRRWRYQKTLLMPGRKRRDANKTMKIWAGELHQCVKVPLNKKTKCDAWTWNKKEREAFTQISYAASQFKDRTGQTVNKAEGQDVNTSKQKEFYWLPEIQYRN